MFYTNRARRIKALLADIVYAPVSVVFSFIGIAVACFGVVGDYFVRGEEVVIDYLAKAEIYISDKLSEFENA